MKVELRNTTKKLCVIGDPVMHSKSLPLHNTMLQALGLDYVYLCQPVPAGQAAQWLSAAKFCGYAGFNATIPHKQALVPLMDSLDEDARMYGAVNTVCLRDGRAYGHNTDGRGFLQSLLDQGVDPAGRRFLLLGAGGAARAVALKLVQQGAAGVTVCNRTPEHAAALCAQDPTGRMVPAGFDREYLCRAAERAEVLVNCTSLGMTGVEAKFSDFSFLDALPEGAMVCDLIYAPAQTRLLAEAARRGHRTMNGAAMLIYQAVFALEHFTDTHIEARPMLDLLRPLLEE